MTTDPIPPDRCEHDGAPPEQPWRSVAEAEGRRDEGDLAAAISPRLERRDFMKLMGASLALASAGCTRKPFETIVPYRSGPSEQTYGKPVYYATTLPVHGFGLGVLVETNMGRPTKIEGNPDHPASSGATDVFAQAAVLELWDPDRSQAVRHGPDVATYELFAGALSGRLQALAAQGGRGFHILTETVASPTLHAQLGALLARYPNARWHQWLPVNRDFVLRGHELAYGKRLDVLCHFDRTRVVFAADGDFLDDHPAFVRYAGAFARTRAAGVEEQRRCRLYALECTPTLTGAAADHRQATRASDVADALVQLADALGIAKATRRVVPDAWIIAAAADLDAHRGASIVQVGERQPPHVHALAAAINEHLGNVGHTVELIAPAAIAPVDHLASLRELVEAMRRGDVDTLLVSGANPVYNAPADLAFGDALAKVRFKAHHGLYLDETAARCDWHLPAAHSLEAWGDLRSFDGSVSLQQPCIAPLYDGISAVELFARVGGALERDGHALVRAQWKRDHAGDFETALREGIAADTAAQAERPALLESAVTSAPGAPPTAGLELVFAPDPRTNDGRYANNAWLQELPKPLSKLTWDNAAYVAPALARRMRVENGDVVRIRSGERALQIPVWIMPGMPDRSVALSLGYGRSNAGSVGSGRGANAYLLRTSGSLWLAAPIDIAATGKRRLLASTQTHQRMEGRDLIRVYTRAQAAACTAKTCGTPDSRDQATLFDRRLESEYQWAMSIDLSSCIGCGTCTIACQAENNIPVVGRDEVLKSREMHWIRVDRYYAGGVDDPRTLFQPVPCMHCEHAPCEPVCPVEASIHDAQGLNLQVYNRCIGTRFCSNNCPYKVRRFNWLEYSTDVPTLDAQRNPEVTVRMRGVMEKCTYCVQRITTAKIAADREGRRLRDGEVVTACQAACPTRAIVFGDLNLPDSGVNERKRSPLDYALLAELGTRPRTTYLPHIVDPSPQLPEGGGEPRHADAGDVHASGARPTASREPGAQDG